MEIEINVSIILDAVRMAGNIFLKNYKRKAIPHSMGELLEQLDDIDSVCLDSLKKI